ncbi:MAG: site-2 protease family protein [Rhodothermales bacterium]
MSNRERGGVSSSYRQSTRPRDRYWLHILLFLLTLASTVYMGGDMAGRWLLYEQQGMWLYVLDGLRFGLSLLLFLTVHEFGHYFAARHHGVDTSLPYYIPLPFAIVGTLGAVIRIREPVPSTRKLFDIGVAGPLAGFVVALAILIYAVATLPPPTYILAMPGHEAMQRHVEQFGEYPTEMPGHTEGTVILIVGQTLLYWLLTQFGSGVPPMYEMYHYPILFAGWLGLFFTALNLLPVGQLDGGHILYALFGRKWHARLARGFFVLLLISGSLGFVTETAPMLYDLHTWAGEAAWFLLAAILYFFLHKAFSGDLRLIGPLLLGIILFVLLAQNFFTWFIQFGYTGWFVWCLLIVYLIKIDHPPVLYEEPLTRGRKILGILSIIVLILCFSFRPLYIMS